MVMDGGGPLTTPASWNRRAFLLCDQTTGQAFGIVLRKIENTELVVMDTFWFL
jgi:hypothetical protein